MKTLSLLDLANAVACTLAECGEAPEGHLYAGIMAAGATLEDFSGIKRLLLGLGLVTEATGPVLIATKRLRAMHNAVKNPASGGDAHVFPGDQAGESKGSLSAQAKNWQKDDCASG